MLSRPGRVPSALPRPPLGGAALVCAEVAEPAVRLERRAYLRDGVALRVGVDEHCVVLERLEVVTARADEPAAMPAGDDRAGGGQGAARLVGQIAMEGDEPGSRGFDSPGSVDALSAYDPARPPGLPNGPLVEDRTYLPLIVEGSGSALVARRGRRPRRWRCRPACG
jgi:hypothetical protein